MTPATAAEKSYEGIMWAAYRALVAHGYADLTMRDIADEFEKSRSVIHYHFDTKQELLGSLFEFLVDRYQRAMLKAAPAADDPDALLETFVDIALWGPDDGPFDHWAFWAALLEFRSFAHRDDRYHLALETSYRQGVDILAAIIEAGIDAGQFREVPARRTARFIHNAIDSIRIERITLGHEDAPKAGRAALEELVLEPLRTGVSPEAGRG